MRVTRDTPDELVLDYAPWVPMTIILVLLVVFLGAGMAALAKRAVLQGLMFGGIGTVACGGALYAFAERRQLWLSRQTGTATLRCRSFRGLTERQVALADVAGALLEQGGRAKGGRPLQRPGLRLKGGGRMDIIEPFMTGPGPERAVTAINAWLARR
jgi:hypothetical protein